ncbi:pyridoxamine 5'-phosphate oxidase family protein [Halosegnis marinus]|uniref:Pyridoxamine 5'-phosphate oxidase family protein n=1 Tax=Halosegnis marinus TaxID=3034023 RepID=A0ABD5ZQW8_9EURY|nr:PPOX class F420-dependent oxidoreductase [Halosegnis sp. DT85]
MAEIPESFHDLFERRTFAHVTTLMPDGGPQTTPVWVDYDEDTGEVLVNTARGRRKEKNIRHDPRVAVSMTDPDDGYRYLSVRGEAELTTEGAVEHIDALARRYMDVEEYPHHGEEDGERVLVRIAPDSVAHSG